MKKLSVILLVFLLIFSNAFGCAKNNIVRYDLSDVNFANITVEHYEYSYIEFNYDNHTYKLQNKAKQSSTVVTQTGTFIVDKDNYVTITNDSIPSQNYLLYTGEQLYFRGNNFYATAYISGYGSCSMIFSK